MPWFFLLNMCWQDNGKIMFDIHLRFYVRCCPLYLVTGTISTASDELKDRLGYAGEIGMSMLTSMAGDRHIQAAN